MAACDRILLSFAVDFFGEFTGPFVLILIAVIILVFASSRRIKSQNRPVRPKPAKRFPPSDQEQITANLQKLLINLQDLARQINAHIDTRFCKLEVLIKQADERIKRLEQLTGATSKDPSSSDKKGEAGDRPPEEDDPDRAVIYKLADIGKSPVEIAQELKKHPGEVELILSLRRNADGGKKVDYRIE